MSYLYYCLFVIRYYELDIHVSLRENLRGKQIIEFPTISVILKHQKDEYEFMESGECMVDNPNVVLLYSNLMNLSQMKAEKRAQIEGVPK